MLDCDNMFVEELHTKGELVQVVTTDEIVLEGFCIRPLHGSDKAVIHFPGLASNFYENPLVWFLCRAVVGAGITFATVNHRGHDYIADLRVRKAGQEAGFRKAGAAYELFEEFTLDAEAWIQTLGKTGCKQFFLQGHSSGALKVLYYQRQSRNPNTAGIILLSPSDDVGLQQKALGGRFDESVALSRDMVQRGKGNEFIPTIFYDFPISAKTYFNMFGPNTSNIVNSQDITCPILAIIGDRDPYITEKAEIFLKRIRKQAMDCTDFHYHVIVDGNHRYTGREADAVKHVLKFLQATA